MGEGNFTGDSRVRTIAGIVVLLAVVPFVVHAFPATVGADHSYVVLSSSMRPTYHAGDVVFVEEVPPRRIEPGDVITFHPPSGSDLSDTERVTHRVVDVVHRDGKLYFRTKGDANEEPDEALVPAENVVGVVVFSLPYVGRVITFARSDAGIVAFVVVPAVLLIVSEVWRLFRGSAESVSSDGEPSASEDQTESTDSDE